MPMTCQSAIAFLAACDKTILVARDHRASLLLGMVNAEPHVVVRKASLLAETAAEEQAVTHMIEMVENEARTAMIDEGFSEEDWKFRREDVAIGAWHTALSRSVEHVERLLIDAATSNNPQPQAYLRYLAQRLPMLRGFVS